MHATPFRLRSPQRVTVPFAGRRLVRALVVLASLSTPAAARAQGAVEAESPLPDAPCEAGRISAVWVDNHSVFDLSDPSRNQRFDWAFRLANRLHIATREEVIQRELLFREGGCYDPALLLESERVLRASTFIAEVDIYGVQQPDGSYHVIVDTRDEWSTRVNVQTGTGTGLQLAGISLQEDNLLGTGRRAALFYRRWEAQEVYGATYVNPQLFGTRWQAGVSAGRTPVGSFFRESVEYPFVGETGRWAFRHHVEHHDRYFGYLAGPGGSADDILMPERRRSFDVGAARRFGRRGHLTMVGLMLAGDWVSYPGTARVEGVLASLSPDSLLAPIDARLDSLADMRAMLIVGQRNVHYVRDRALDTVNGTEDVRLGVEVEMGIGRSFGGISSRDYLSMDLGIFASERIAPSLLVGGRAVVEGKRNYGAPITAPEWDDVFAQGDAWAYWRPTGGFRHTVVAALSGAGGWNARVPFQLTIGGATGLRGQPFRLAPGAQRLVASAELRSYLGWPYPQLFDLGTVAFVDAGRIWAGSAPFGVDSKVFGNLGLGLRGAFPPGSQNTLRLDVAAPFDRLTRPSELVFSIGVQQAIGRAVRFDDELHRSSRRGAATSVFPVRTDAEP